MANRKIEDLLPEETLIKMYGVSEEALRTWRSSGLEFVQLGRGCRGYWADAVVTWLEKNRTRRQGSREEGGD